jgi:hypothetical protein
LIDPKLEDLGNLAFIYFVVLTERQFVASFAQFSKFVDAVLEEVSEKASSLSKPRKSILDKAVPVISPDAALALSVVQPIYILHETFLNDLEKRFKTNGLDSKFVSDRIYQFSSLLTIYEDYIQGFFDAFALSREPSFLKYLESRNQPLGLTLASLLSFPMHRVQMLGVFLEVLASITPDDDPEFSSIQTSLYLFRSRVAGLRSHFEEMENRYEINCIEKEFGGLLKLEIPGRKFIRRGEFDLVCVLSRGHAKKSAELSNLSVLLFSDCLLEARQQSDSEKLEVYFNLPLSSVKLIDVPSSFDSSSFLGLHFLCISTEGTELVFATESKELVSAWTEDLDRAINALSENSESSSTQSGGLSKHNSGTSGRAHGSSISGPPSESVSEGISLCPGCACAHDSSNKFCPRCGYAVRDVS